MSGRVFVLGGPTAAGKTALALELAERLGAHLVSADAMQVYRGMDIGTAKPDAETLRRFPHTNIDVREVDEEFNVADFLLSVERARALHPRVLVVGGTPFWLAALCRPMAALPPGDPVLRRRLEALPDPHAALAAVDPASAARLHPHDRVRVVRALEVHALTGRPMGELWARGPRAPVDLAGIAWLDRQDLRARIALRLGQMMARGYLEEVESLRARGFGPAHKPMRSLGYRHLDEHLAGRLPLDEAVRRTERDTWGLARKQRTWARGMGWAPLDEEAAREAALRALEAGDGG